MDGIGRLGIFIFFLSVISPPKVMPGWTNGKRGRHRQKGLTLNLTAEFLYNTVNDGIN